MWTVDKEWREIEEDERTWISETLYAEVKKSIYESMFNGYNHRVAHEGPFTLGCRYFNSLKKALVSVTCSILLYTKKHH